MELRPVIIEFGGTELDSAPAMSTDAYKAVVKRVEEIEKKYNEYPDSVVDVTDAKVILTGYTPYTVYVFNLTTVLSNATYKFEFVE
jgi:hypothetical protein